MKVIKPGIKEFASGYSHRFSESLSNLSIRENMQAVEEIRNCGK